jgi:3-oxoacyl-[acyl-carrier protein] reductase
MLEIGAAKGVFIVNIDGSHILITGGGGAFGSAFARDFASRGACVLACDRDEEALGRLKKEAAQENLAIHTHAADITREADVEGLFSVFLDRFRRLDVVINNAGVAEDGLLIRKKGEALERFPLGRWQRGLAVNLTGVFLCGREGAFHMVRRGTGGLILNVSSISRHGNFIQSNYSATKAAVVALTVVWAKELSRYGIRAVAVAPGYVDTPLTRNVPEKIRQRIVSSEIPQARLGTLDEVIHAVRFAIENDYMNGRVIDLDGGLRI